MSIEGVNVPQYRDSAHISKINSSLIATDVHDHSEGNGNPVKRIDYDSVSSRSLRASSVSTEKIEDEAVNLDKLADFNFGEFSKVRIAFSKALLGQTDSLSYVEVLSDEYVPESAPVFLEGLKAGDIVDIGLVSVGVSSIFALIGNVSVYANNSSNVPAGGRLAFVDQNNVVYPIGDIDLRASTASGADPLLKLPCGGFGTNILITEDGDYSFVLKQRVTQTPMTPAVIETGGVRIMAKVIRPIGGL